MWRVPRGGDPYARRFPRTDLTKGNRFDPLTLGYDVVYFGTDLERCFGLAVVLACFLAFWRRPDGQHRSVGSLPQG